MPDFKKCRACGVEIQSNAPFGHCPQCLLAIGFGPVPKEALESLEEPQTQSATGSPQPSVNTVRCFGDYELLEQIGRGGMGVVFKARHISLRRLVALKMISAGELAPLTAVQRFQVEAEAVAKLDHPNIVPIYEIGVREGQHYFTMKLVEGGSLEEKCKVTRDRGEPNGLPALRIAVLFLQKVARAVHYAHQHGVIHRDLKPANILIDAQSEPHVTDFGLAKILEHERGVTRTAELMGTPAYMSPEQAAGRQLSTAADIWSLGVILYEWLAGQPPFRAENTPALLRKIAEEEPAPPSRVAAGVPPAVEGGVSPPGNERGVFDLNPTSQTESAGQDARLHRRRDACRYEIDRDLETICLKCLEKDPPRRYASAAALADDLEHWLRHEPILARRASLFERVTKWARRQPVLAAAVAALHLVLGLGLAGVLWQWSRAEKQLARAERAEAAAINGLYEAKLNYVRANRLTGRPGQRLDSLAEIAHAARRTNSLDLRNEAIACAVLPDARRLKQWVKTPHWYSFLFDSSHRRYATNELRGFRFEKPNLIRAIAARHDVSFNKEILRVEIEIWEK